MQEYRCKFCHRLLFKCIIMGDENNEPHKIIVEIADIKYQEHIAKMKCKIEIKCVKCNKINTFHLK